jgi:hypothetical protein
MAAPPVSSIPAVQAGGVAAGIENRKGRCIWQNLPDAVTDTREAAPTLADAPPWRANGALRPRKVGAAARPGAESGKPGHEGPGFLTTPHQGGAKGPRAEEVHEQRQRIRRSCEKAAFNLGVAYEVRFPERRVDRRAAAGSRQRGAGSDRGFGCGSRRQARVRGHLRQ